MTKKETKLGKNPLKTSAKKAPSLREPRENKIQIPAAARQAQGPVSKTKEKVNQMINQARESLKILQTLEKETFAKAKTFVRNPLPKNSKSLTNDRILSSLKHLGIATQSEVDLLKLRIDKLEAALANSKISLNKTSTAFASKNRPAASPLPQA